MPLYEALLSTAAREKSVDKKRTCCWSASNVVLISWGAAPA